MTTVNPPPLKIPDNLSKDPETQAFIRDLLQTIRLMWVKTGNDPSNGGTMPIADGGTGATNALDARDNLGLEIGADVQGWDSDIDVLAGFSHALNAFTVSEGKSFALKSLSDTKNLLGIGTNSSPTFSYLYVTNDADIRGRLIVNNILVRGSFTINDDAFTVRDESDTSKELQFQLSGITTATTRTLTIPDESGTVVLNDNTATLTNKTLTNPVFDEYLDINESSEPGDPGSGVARLWNLAEGGFSTIHWKNGSRLDHEISRDAIHVVRNTSGGTLPAGEVVYITGSNGTFPTVAKAKADSNTTMPAFGIVLADISDNSFGQIMQAGDAQGIDFSAFTEGAAVYVSAATAGALTETAPTGTNLPQRVGVITKSNASGIIGVTIGSIDDPGLTQTLSNKTIDSASNTLTLDLSEGTLTGTKSEFDTAVSDGNIAFAGGAFHDGFSDYVANEHIDWTSDQGATNINSANITGLSIGTEVTGASTDLTDTADITYNADTDISSNGWFLDEDDMASDDATKAPSQQSVKAYVDNNADGLNAAKVAARIAEGI